MALERLPDTGPHGMGLIPSAPDQSDYQIESLFTSAGITVGAAPPSLKVTSMPPVLNQGQTVQCASFSASCLKAQQDLKETGKFYDFDEAALYYSVGGGTGGTSLKAILNGMLTAGFPVTGVADSAKDHKIAAYFRVTKDIETIKTAIAEFGPLHFGCHWYHSWSRPYTNGVLPDPDTYGGGHAWVGYGYTPDYLIARNSWGAGWGLGGDFLMPWWMVIGTAIFDIFKTVDAKTPVLFTRAQLNTNGINIRESAGVVGSTTLAPVYAHSVNGVVRRYSDNADLGHWIKPDPATTKFSLFKKGATHGIAPYPDEWAAIWCGYAYRAVARPLVTLS